MKQWHLVLDDRCPPELNMAKDSALFESVLDQTFQGTFRIYNWDRPGITIGRHQQGFAPADPDLSIPVLRRPTGGGAVLHVDDITFSICAPEQGAFSKGIPGACAAVSRVFARSLKECGIEAEMRGDHTAFSPVCFQRSSPVELCLDGTKILGLALLRRKGFILLQGVLPLRTDRTLSDKVFGAGSDPGTAGIMDLAPGFVEGEFIKHLTAALSSEMDITFKCA